MTTQKVYREKLVTALRSGDYEQGKDVLRGAGFNDDEYVYCCLGVACDLIPMNSWNSTYMESSWKADDNHGNISDITLPKAIRKVYGFRVADGAFKTSGLSANFLDNLSTHSSLDKLLLGNSISLSSLNDHGVDFNTIADIIESEPEGLFE